MAREAILQGMGAQQRKTVLVLLHRLQRNFPALHRVALLALCAELAAVNIGMAVRALRSHVGEHQARVTQAALHGFVHAAQWIARLVMIEFRKIADGLPAGEGVTILTSLVQRAVRAARGAALLRRLGCALLRLRAADQRRANEERRENLFAVGQWEHGLHPRAGVKEQQAISNPEMRRVRSGLPGIVKPLYSQSLRVCEERHCVLLGLERRAYDWKSILALGSFYSDCGH